MRSLPEVFMFNCRMDHNKDVEFWRAQQQVSTTLSTLATCEWWSDNDDDDDGVDDDDDNDGDDDGNDSDDDDDND